MAQEAVAYGLCQCGCGGQAPRAPWTSPKRGWIKGEPLRYIVGHACRKSGVDYVIEDRGYETPCWVWQLAKISTGYGVTSRGGTRDYAHRYYYKRYCGPIPQGKHLDHLCRRRDCVNPAHLEPVTRHLNAQRGVNAKLTEAMVREIRSSPLPSVELAHRFGVHRGTIDDARRGTTWANVEELRAGATSTEG